MALATLLLCLVTFAVTWRALRDEVLRDRLLFRPEDILRRREWHRLFSCALIHADWAHVAFNLLGLYSFGRVIERYWGPGLFLTIYVAAVLGGSALSLWLQRHRVYAALGASGGVCGVIFAAIFLVPGTGVSLLFLPVAVPGPLYALGYLVWTFVALRRGLGHIGHDAHFGGAVVGLLIAAIVAPGNCLASPVLFGLALAVAVGCLALLAWDPHGVLTAIATGETRRYRPSLRHQQYDDGTARRAAENEIDRILDKIATRGLTSLTPLERATLAARSARSRRP